MATPIQHTSMFVPSNMGVLERGLQQTQQRADAAYQGYLQTETQLNDALVSNEDAARKEELISNFKQRSKDRLSEYGNDWAKASKGLAKEVVKAGSDPFWKINAAKQAAIQQYNQMKTKLGSNAIEGYNPASKAVYNKDTGYTSPEEFTPVVYDANVLSTRLDKIFGDRKRSLNDELLKKATSGMLNVHTIRGIQEERVPELANEMYNQLKTEASMVNEYGDTQLRQLAENTAKSYVMGETDKYMQDPEWMTKQRADSKKIIVNSDPTSNRLGGAVIDKTFKSADKDFNEFKEAMSSYNDITLANKGGILGSKLEGVKSQFRNATGSATYDVKNLQDFLARNRDKIGVDSPKGNMYDGILEVYDQLHPDNDNLTRDNQGNITGVVMGRAGEVARSVYNDTQGDVIGRAEQFYKNALSKFDKDPTYIDITSTGVEPIKAAEYVTNLRKEMYSTHYRYDKPHDRGIDSKVVNDFMVNINDFNGVTSIDKKGRVENIKSKDFKNILGDTKVIASEFNLMSGTVALTFNDSGTIKQYEVPIDNLGNDTIKNSMKSYNKFLNVLYLKEPSINDKGKVDGVVKNASLYLGNNEEFVFSSKYNENSGEYDRELVYFYEDPQTGQTEKHVFPSFDAGLAFFTEKAAVALVDNYGTQAKYKNRYR